MKLFVISDTHFGHKKLAAEEFRGPNFENKIIENWNKMITPLDTVFMLGDFSLGRYKDFSLSESVLMWRNQLAGTIVLIRGNHDNETVTWYMNHGFVLCVDKLELEYKGKKLIMTHRPIEIENGESNIHGHIHSQMRLSEYKGLNLYKGHHINVALEHTDYMPLSLDNIVENILFVKERQNSKNKNT